MLLLVVSPFYGYLTVDEGREAFSMLSLHEVLNNIHPHLANSFIKVRVFIARDIISSSFSLKNIFCNGFYLSSTFSLPKDLFHVYFLILILFPRVLFVKYSTGSKTIYRVKTLILPRAEFCAEKKSRLPGGNSGGGF